MPAKVRPSPVSAAPGPRTARRAWHRPWDGSRGGHGLGVGAGDSRHGPAPAFLALLQLLA